MLDEKLRQYQREVEREVLGNILPFWINNAIDNENGGFYTHISNDLTVHKDAPRGSVLFSRILWTFARAYNIYRNPLYLLIAKRAAQYLENHFIDEEFGGVYWSVDYKGCPIECKKQIYAQAFAIYGLSEYYAAAGYQKTLNQLQEIFQHLEQFAYDGVYKGFYDACHRDWSLDQDMRLSAKDLNSRKSMNTNLHILEAYSNLLRVWPNSVLKDKLRELTHTLMENVIDKRTNHLKLYFDDNWRTLNDHISYGHDIEGSWLLLETARELQDPVILEKVKEVSIKMARTVYQEGMDSQGGIINDGNNGGDTGFDREWWPQAEAMVGFLNAYQITEEEIFLDASLKVWNFVKNYFIDNEHGEWFHSVDKNGKIINCDKVEFWKCPYHNSRACFEVKKRLESILAQKLLH